MNKEREDEFAFGKDNYKYLIIGVSILILGNVLLIGGASDDPNVFNPEVFSATRMYVAPLVILAGFATVLIAIIKKSK